MSNLCIKCGHESQNKTCRKCKSGYNKEYYIRNKDAIKSATAKYRKENREAINKNAAVYRDKNRDQIKLRQREYVKTNKDKVLERNRQNYANNREDRRSQKRRYIKENRHKRRAYVRARKSNDPLFALSIRIRGNIRTALRDGGVSKRPSQTTALLGSDLKSVKEYLNSTFTSRYGYEPDPLWRDLHIDHIVPCASAKTEEELIKLQHYTNLQLLTAEDNLRKGTKHEEY